MKLPEVITLPSGAKLSLKLAPFENNMDLLELTAQELTKVSLGMKIELSLGDPKAMIQKLLQDDLPVDVIKNIAFGLMASKILKAQIVVCAGRSLYDGKSVTIELFEPAEARQDFLVMAWEVMKFNLLPFFAGLRSKLSTPGAATSSTPR